MPEATLHDGSTIEIEVDGEGPTLLLPVNPHPVTGPQAEAMRQWGADPALGHSLIKGLSDAFRVVAFDYEGQCLRIPKPDTLTPANTASDLLAVADAVGADRFAYYGYSWLALIGLQLAIRTGRLSALIMGGFPPLNGPYAAMLRVTTAAHEMAVEAAAKTDEVAADQQPAVEAGDWSSVQVTISPDQTRQFVTLYRAPSWKASAGRCECSMGWITCRPCRRSRWCRSCVRGWRPSFGHNLFPCKNPSPARALPGFLHGRMENE